MAGVNLLAFYLSLLSKHVMELNSGEGGIDNKKIAQDDMKLETGENYPIFLPPIETTSLRNISESRDYDFTELYEDDLAGDDFVTDSPSSVENGN